MAQRGVRRTKAAVGLVAIALIVVFTILVIIGTLSFSAAMLADVAVAVIANLIFRTVGRVGKHT